MEVNPTDNQFEGKIMGKIRKKIIACLVFVDNTCNYNPHTCILTIENKNTYNFKKIIKFTANIQKMQKIKEKKYCTRHLKD